MVAPHYDFLIKLLLIGDSGESAAGYCYGTECQGQRDSVAGGG
jgi:hypothetical protein